MPREIKTLTVVTGQGVCCYHSSKKIAIVEETYRVCGDPYPCYHVITDNQLTAEIRCVHNVAIDYKYS